MMSKRRGRSYSSSNLDLLYGRRPVCELLRAGRRRVSRIFFQKSCEQTPELKSIVVMADKNQISIEERDRRKLDGLTFGANHQGIVAEASPYPYLALDERTTCDHALWLLLDHFLDPQNFGSMLRTAEAAGVTGVVIPAARAVGVTAAVVRASAGASEHVSVYRVSNICRAMRTLQSDGIYHYGLSVGKGGKPYTSLKGNQPIGIVVGSEGYGLRRLVFEACDRILYLPLFGSVASINAATAGAIALFEVVRQRGRPLEY